MPGTFTCTKCGHEMAFKGAFPQTQSLTCKKCGGRSDLGLKKKDHGGKSK